MTTAATCCCPSNSEQRIRQTEESKTLTRLGHAGAQAKPNRINVIVAATIDLINGKHTDWIFQSLFSADQQQVAFAPLTANVTNQRRTLRKGRDGIRNSRESPKRFLIFSDYDKYKALIG